MRKDAAIFFLEKAQDFLIEPYAIKSAKACIAAALCILEETEKKNALKI